MLEERRKFPRFEIEQMIELSFGKESYLHAAGVDISETGLLCESSEYVEPLTRLYLMVGLSANDYEKQKITCEGIVLRSFEQDGRFSIAVNFTTMQEEDRKKLNNYMESAFLLKGSL